MKTIHLSVEQLRKVQGFLDTPPTTVEDLTKLTDYLNELTQELKPEIEAGGRLAFSDINLVDQLTSLLVTVEEALGGQKDFVYAQEQLRAIHPHLPSAEKHVFRTTPWWFSLQCEVKVVKNNLAHLSNKQIEELFDRHIPDEYHEFDRVEAKLSRRPDMHGLMLLDRLCPMDDPGTPALVCTNYGSIVFFGFKIEQFKLSATEQDVIELCRCGYYYDDDYGWFAKIVENRAKRSERPV